MTTQPLPALVVDDEADSREILQLLLRDYCPTVTVVGEAGSLPAAREAILTLRPKIVFLDIQIGNETIFSLLSEFKSPDFLIIFVTAYEHHAMRAFEFMAVDYLKKPVQIPALIRAVNSAVNRLATSGASTPVAEIMQHLQEFNHHQRKIALATSRGYELVYIHDIMYCQAKGSYTEFTFKTGPALLVSRNLKYYEKLLEEYHFVRSHNTNLINLQYVKVLERTGSGNVIMEDDVALPISRTKRQELDARIKERRRLI